MSISGSGLPMGANIPLEDQDSGAHAVASARVIFLARHAQPLIAQGVCYGATDMPSDEAATRDAALEIARQLPQGTRLVSSPLRRCMQLTEELLRLRPDIGATTDARLVEMNFGCWEGHRWGDIPKQAIDQWTAQFGTWRFGGRESVQELMDRVAAARAETLAAHGPATWITHAGVIRAAMLLSRGTAAIERGDQWPREAISFGRYLSLPQRDGSAQQTESGEAGGLNYA